jgi:hypothetical protein
LSAEHATVDYLAARLIEGIGAIRAGERVAGTQALLEVLTAPGMSAAGDLADVRARGALLLASALLDMHRLEEARVWISGARELCDAVGDGEGLTHADALDERVRELAQTALHEHAQKTRAVALLAQPLEVYEASTPAGPAQVDLLVRYANAEVAFRSPAAGVAIADRAVALAHRFGWTRQEVMARLVVARALPDRTETELLTAWRAADQDNNTGLITLVCKAAAAAGVELPAQHGPDMGT